MVEVVTLCARRGEDGGVGDGRGVVAGNSTREDGGDGDDEDVRCALSEDGDRDRDEDAERAPARPCGKGEPRRDEEEERRQEHDNTCVCLYDGADEAAEIEILLAADAGERPRKAENEDGGGHRLEAPAETVTEHVEGNDAARQIEQPRKDEGDERAEYERLRRIAVCKRLRNAFALVDAARIEHAIDARADQHEEGEHEIDHLAVALARRTRGCLCRVLILLWNLEMCIRFLNAPAHRTEVAPRPDDEEHEQDGQPCVEVERNRLQKQHEAVDLRVRGEG